MRPARGGSRATTAAARQTIGVYTLAKRVMNFSLEAFFSEAFSTISRILLAVDSPKLFSTRISSAPLRLMHPAMTCWPEAISRGMDSPVRAAVSSWDAPRSTTPSRGTFSPGRTRMV